MSLDLGKVLIFLIAGLIVHLFLALMQAKDVKWVPRLSRSEVIYWYVIIWLIPFVGAFIARKEFNLPKDKGNLTYDSTNDDQDPF